MIDNISTYDNEQLVHFYKCALSKKLASEKKLFDPLIKAIEKERKSRGTTSISSAVKPKEAKQSIGQASDMYEEQS